MLVLLKTYPFCFFRWQLASSEREFISSALNSTLLEAGGFPARPPLEVSQPLLVAVGLFSF